MKFRNVIGRFIYFFFAFFGLRTIGDVLLRTPEETAAHLYSYVPYVASLIFAVIMTGYYYYIGRKNEQKPNQE